MVEDLLILSRSESRTRNIPGISAGAVEKSMRQSAGRLKPRACPNELPGMSQVMGTGSCRLFLNIIQNAISYTAEGKVTALSSRNKYVEVVVRDTGIPAESLSRVFEASTGSTEPRSRGREARLAVNSQTIAEQRRNSYHLQPGRSGD